MSELRTELSEFRIQAKEKDLSLLYNVKTGSGAHPAPYKMGTRVLRRE